MPKNHNLKVIPNEAQIDVAIGFLESNFNVISTLVTSENKDDFIDNNKTVQQLKKVWDLYEQLP